MHREREDEPRRADGRLQSGAVLLPFPPRSIFPVASTESRCRHEIDSGANRVRNHNQTYKGMHPRITELLDYVERQTATLRDAYESVPAEKRAVRPAPDRWSPAEIIHHLEIVERRLAQALGRMIEQARALPPETETTPAVSPDRAKAGVDRTKRFVTSEPFTPRDTDPTRVWDDLMRAREGLIGVIGTGDGLALGEVSAPHPALGTLTGYEWIAFVGSHAARHADQIREMNTAR
jgi:hypothetical protein